ncbi:MAG: ABC transporter ATP-binding protein [Bacillota bacterium]|nr:ABC transporter ATP-binding protein [Bacillota bacterium]
MTREMIKVSGLTFAYSEAPVLNDINFEIGSGQLVAILGPNGAGKSTLFKCILGLIRKHKGQIFLEGKDIKHLNRKEIARIAAYIPQSERPVFNYSVRDSILMGTTGMLSPLQSPGAEHIAIADEAIDYLGIGYMADRGINEISGGERQLALLARAMAQKAKILIMDEPTANLDYGNQQHVLKHIQKMAEQGYTILLSTHNPEHALQYATHVLAIKDHRVLAAGKAEETLTEELIKEIYGLEIKILEARIGNKLVRSCIPVGSVENDK